jgi:hypothetical protein
MTCLEELGFSLPTDGGKNNNNNNNKNKNNYEEENTVSGGMSPLGSSRKHANATE